MNHPDDNAVLMFEGRAVAELSEIFEDQSTWFADYRLCFPLLPELKRFIDFNRDHLSTGNFEESELQSFAHYISVGQWSIKRKNGVDLITGAPVFRESDLSWIEK
ncbi:MAG: hypothetical protein ACAH88_13855 [Roseimicrobium sp.]